MTRVRGVSIGVLVLAGWAVLQSTTVSTAPGAAPQSPPRVQAPPPAVRAAAAPVASHEAVPVPSKAFLTTYCITCHNQRLKTGGLALDTLDVENVGKDAEVWERAVVKLQGGPDAAGRPAAAAAAGDRRIHRVARSRARSRRRGQSEPGPHRALSPLEPRRVSECHPRPARPRGRRVAVAAHRRDQLRLRQHRRRPEAVAAAHRALPERRPEDLAPRARHARAAQRRSLPRARPARSGRAARGHAGGNARRHPGELPGVARRRVRPQGARRPRHRFRHPALHRRAAARDQHRRRVRPHVHDSGDGRRGPEHRAPGREGAGAGAAARGAARRQR